MLAVPAPHLVAEQRERLAGGVEDVACLEAGVEGAVMSPAASLVGLVGVSPGAWAESLGYLASQLS